MLALIISYLHPILLGVLFAAEQAQSQDILQYFQYGAMGLIVVGFLMGYIWPKPAVDRLIKDKERAEEQVTLLVKTYEEKVIPLLQEVDDKLLPAMGEVAQAVRDVRRDMEMFYRHSGEDKH